MNMSKINLVRFAMMKQLTFVVIFTIIGLSSQQDFDGAIAKCHPKFPSVELGVPEAICKSSTSTSDPEVKCMIKCVGEEAGVVSADGKMITSKVNIFSSTDADKTKVDEAVKKCSAVVEKDACETAYQQLKCMCDFAVANM